MSSIRLRGNTGKWFLPLFAGTQRVNVEYDPGELAGAHIARGTWEIGVYTTSVTTFSWVVDGAPVAAPVLNDDATMFTWVPINALTGEVSVTNAPGVSLSGGSYFAVRFTPPTSSVSAYSEFSSVNSGINVPGAFGILGANVYVQLYSPALEAPPNNTRIGSSTLVIRATLADTSTYDLNLTFNVALTFQE